MPVQGYVSAPLAPLPAIQAAPAVSEPVLAAAPDEDGSVPYSGADPNQSADMDGKVRVRLAAVPSRQAALALWQNLEGLAPDLLDGRTPLVSKQPEHAHASWRLGTGGFQDAAAAEQFCQRLRARGPDCSVGL